MSMHYEGYSEFGLFIPSEYMEGFVDKYNKAHPEDKIKEIETIDIMSEFEGIKRSFNASYLDEQFEGITILPLRGGFWSPLKEGLVVFAEKSDAANQIFQHGFYKSPEEVYEEMKDKVGDYLPEDFDYEGYTGDIQYALFG